MSGPSEEHVKRRGRSGLECFTIPFGLKHSGIEEYQLKPSWAMKSVNSRTGNGLSVAATLQTKQQAE